MMPPYHICISAGLGAVFIVWFNSFTAAISCFLCGVLIDLDHHLDYLIAKHEIPWRYKDLVYFGATDKNHKMYLWFHSYESLVLFWAAIFILDLNIVWVGAAVGLTVHLLCDQLANPMHPLAYFLTYRIKQGFSKEKLLAKNFFKQVRPY